MTEQTKAVFSDPKLLREKLTAFLKTTNDNKVEKYAASAEKFFNCGGREKLTFTPTWSWWCFFGPIFFFFYRKLYLYAIILFILGFLPQFVVRIDQNEIIANWKMYAGIGISGTIILNSLLAMFAKYFVIKRFEKALNLGEPKFSVMAGKNAVLLWIFLAPTIIILVGVIGFFGYLYFIIGSLPFSDSTTKSIDYDTTKSMNYKIKSLEDAKEVFLEFEKINDIQPRDINIEVCSNILNKAVRTNSKTVAIGEFTRLELFIEENKFELYIADLEGDAISEANMISFEGMKISKNSTACDGGGSVIANGKAILQSKDVESGPGYILYFTNQYKADTITPEEYQAVQAQEQSQQEHREKQIQSFIKEISIGNNKKIKALEMEIKSNGDLDVLSGFLDKMSDSREIFKLDLKICNFTEKSLLRIATNNQAQIKSIDIWNYYMLGEDLENSMFEGTINYISKNEFINYINDGRGATCSNDAELETHFEMYGIHKGCGFAQGVAECTIQAIDEVQIKLN